MPTKRYPGMAREIVEPPRDGEFFFPEEGKMEERLVGGVEHSARHRDAFGSVVGRHPLLFLSGAVAVGVVATSVIFRI